MKMALEKKKILLVEDEPRLVEIYQDVFRRKAKIDFLAAEDRKTALEIAKKEKPDLVLLDIIIPAAKGAILDFEAREGFILLEEIRKNENLKNIKVVTLTNLVTEKDKERSRQLGALEYIVKTEILPLELVKKALGFLGA